MAGSETTQHADYYAMLGVAADADAAAIRRAFRSKVREMHPDVARDDPNANEAFLHLKEVYAVLSDPQRRTTYDVQRANARARAREASNFRRPHAASYDFSGGAARPGGTGGTAGPSAGPRPNASAHNGGWQAPGARPGADTWDSYHQAISIPDLLQRAMKEIAEGRFQHARQDVDAVLSREPENPDALLLMGRLYQAEGKSSEWIRILDDAVRRHPGHVALRLALNQALEAQRHAPPPPPVTRQDKVERQHGYLYGGLGTALAVFLVGAIWPGEAIRLGLGVASGPPNRLALCAFFAAAAVGFALAAGGILGQIDDELFFPDTQGRTWSKAAARQDPPLGLMAPPFALVHYGIAVMFMLAAMATRGKLSASLFIVAAVAPVLACIMGLASRGVGQGTVSWCCGPLLFAIFVGWFFGDFARA